MSITRADRNRALFRVDRDFTEVNLVRFKNRESDYLKSRIEYEKLRRYHFVFLRSRVDYGLAGRGLLFFG